MSHRPADWHVLDLDKDPTPGDPQRVRKLAKNLHDFADDVAGVLRDIKGMAGDDAILTWAGKTADSFTAEFEDAPGKLKKLKKSYEMAGDALADYWPKLERAQALADKALAKGREAQGDLSSAKSKLSSADSWVERAGKEAKKYTDKDRGDKGDVPKPDEDKVKAATRNAHAADKAQSAAKSDVTDAQNALDAAKKMAEDARKMREEAAGVAKKKIDEASDAGIHNRKWWEEIGDWVSDNWDTIVAACKVVVAVLGIVAMIIGGPILGTIVLVAALVVLADTLNKYANGQASLWDVGFAALDCIPGMKGMTSLRGLAKGMKGLKGLKGLKAMANGVRGLGKSARGALKDSLKGAFNRLKNKIRPSGEPVDPATGQMFLEATDISLPGTLPFTFTRRMASGYRTGSWFGPTWASTLDQRLEVDEEGVVFVTEDGMLLAYPHPTGPDDQVFPESGPRWPLTRLDNGGYRITEPISGHSRQFSAPIGELAFLTRITDRNQNAIDFEYDSDGAPLSICHSGGYRIAVSVDGGLVTSLVLAGAADDGSDVTVKRFGYTEGNLTAVINSSGQTLRFEYDERLRISSWEDSNRSRYEYSYDDQDRCISQSGMAGHLANTFTYDVIAPAWPDCRITEVTTGEGATSRFVIDNRCLVVAEVDPVGGTLTTLYDDNEHVASLSDQLGYTTHVETNELGQPLEVIRPDGDVVRYEYNELNLATAVQLPNGASWRYAYDERGNCTATTSPTGSTTRFEYSHSGHLTAVTDGLGNTTQVRCDPAGLAVATTDPQGVTATFDRDGFGRPVSFTDASEQVTHLRWTAEGQLASRQAADGETESWTFDGEGNRLTYTNASGAVTRYEYTHFDLLSARIEPSGVRYEFKHDSQLRLREVVNSLGLTWNYTYDRAGRLIEETDFDDRTLSYEYDAAGRLSARYNALGQVTEYARDSLGRITRQAADGTVSSFSYDSFGNLLEARGADAVLTIERNVSGAPVVETTNGRSVQYEYDAVGRLTKRVTPTGAVSEWNYDTAGRRTGLSLSDRSITFELDPVGRELARCYAGNLTLSHSFDESGRRTNQSVHTLHNGQTVQHRSYNYRADGSLTSCSDLLAGTSHFDLDEAGRVTEVRASNWTERYAYDEEGNQTDAAWPTALDGQEAVGPRTYAGTQITRAGSVRYEHDAQGRVVVRRKVRLSRRPDTWRYEWDADDRLTSVQTPDGTKWRYLYDPTGRRIAKQRLGEDRQSVVEQTDFVWSGSTLCEQTTWSPGRQECVTLTWDHQGLHPIAQLERVATVDAPQEEIDSRFFAIVTDLVGTPTELVGEEGEIAWRTRSTLWGKTAWNSSATAYTPLRFPGQYFDPETGLHYNYFRHYDPESARYVTPDPLGLAPTPNPSTYVARPQVTCDPYGLAPYDAMPAGSPGGAPSFVVDGAGNVQDVRGLGRPDGDFVLSGHGGIAPGDTSVATIPEGTCLSFYSNHGEPISDALGNRIETGSPNPVAVHGPGSQVPDYELHPPDGLNIQGMPRNLTVTQPTRLSELLRPNMGTVHWAACRSVS
ncbi:putative adhesin [Streptomyces sp. NPDC059009]|uniref:putative adhesin n=1 Tax=Streptomyces sp. NPDC059009 TaxID=3346694 RepID=UPI00368A2815